MVAYGRQWFKGDTAMLNRWSLRDQLIGLPTVCVVCGAEGGGALDLCDACRDDLPRVGAACVQCGLPTVSASAQRCGQCLSEPPVYSRTLAAFSYADPIRSLLHRLKFQRKLHVARVLGYLLAEVVRANDGQADLVIPVPLHRARLRERGYNQALELARPVAATLRIPLDTTSCTRVRAAEAQMSLPADQRRKNVKDVFEVTRPIAARRVAIVDDVMTTGATVEELARRLKRAGVEDVQVWVCARATLKA